MVHVSEQTTDNLVREEFVLAEGILQNIAGADGQVHQEQRNQVRK